MQLDFDLYTISGLLIFAGIVFILWKIATKIPSIVLKLVLNSILGIISLALMSAYGAHFGIQVDITPITAGLCGVFGMPGFVVLMLIKIFL